MREFHDSAFKRWFDRKRMVEDLLRGFAPAAAVRGVDFDTLEQLPAEYAGDDMSRSRGDAAWRVRFRGAGAGEWLYLLILLEFQSTVDRHMAARILAYTARMYLKLARGGEAPPDGLPPPVLPVVLYNGERPWSAATEMLAAIAPVGGDLAPFQPRQRYLSIDERRFSIENLPPDNAVSAQIALERGSVESVGPLLRRVAALLAGKEHASLRRAFAELTMRMVARSATARDHPELATALRAAEETGGLGAMGTLLGDRIDAYVEAGVARGRAEGLERGLERGVARGLEREREILSRQAERKFGAEAGARLAALLAEVADPERLAAVGDLVIDCADGAELLARAREDAAGR